MARAVPSLLLAQQGRGAAWHVETLNFEQSGNAGSLYSPGEVCRIDVPEGSAKRSVARRFMVAETSAKKLSAEGSS